MPGRLIAAIVLVPALLIPATTPAAAAPASDRIYLLGADTDYLYWGPDRLDPELGLRSASRFCGVRIDAVPGQSKPCLSGVDPAGGSRTHSLFFLPGSVVTEKITWTGAQPLRFHIEGAFNTFGFPYTVHFVIQKGAAPAESPAAREIAPGVWEGEITSGSPWTTDTVTLLQVRVRTAAPVATIRLELGGKSYLQLPRPFGVSSAPELLDGDVYRPAPSSYATATRSFAFNDGNWAERAFSGTTGPLREFAFDLGQRAEILLAWVEVFDSAFVQDVRAGRPPNAEKLRQGAALRLSRDGQLLGHSGNGNGVAGLGTMALALLDVPPGPLTLAVDSANEDPAQAVPFKLHVLEVRGERTLRSMRWSFLQDRSFRSAAGLCPASYEVVPATDEVRSIALDLDWDSSAPGVPKFTPRFDLPGVGSFACGEAGTGDTLRLNIPIEQVWYVGATPSQDSSHVSAYDTSFQMTAHYTYSTPPAA